MSGYLDVDAFDLEARLEERGELERTRIEELPGYDRWKLISDLDARTDLPASAGADGCPQERWCARVYDKLRAAGLTDGEATDEALRRWRLGRSRR